MIRLSRLGRIWKSGEGRNSIRLGCRRGLVLLMIIVLCSGVYYIHTTRQVKITPVVNQDYLATLYKLLEGAEKEIEIAHLNFRYTLGTIAGIQSQLVKAAKKGVVVRILLDDEMDANRTSVDRFQKVGIDARLDAPNKKTHCKLVVVDRKRVLLGSTNFSYTSINKNNEVNVYLESRRLGKYFSDYFRALWKDSAQEPTLPLTETPLLRPFVNRQYTPLVTGLIEKAKDHIDLVMYICVYSADTPFVESSTRLVESLVEAKQRGVKVKVLLEKSSFQDWLNRENEATARYLEENGVEVCFDTPWKITHSKLLLIDDLAILGSTNWYSRDLDINHQVNLLIRDTETVEFFQSYFNNLWNLYSVQESLP